MRPNHIGNWMECYDGKEAMVAAGNASLGDAAAAEMDGYPTPETAEEWLAAMNYYICTFGGGLAEWNARPAAAAGIVMAKKAIVAAAHMAMSMTIAGPFRSYMPLNSVGHLHYHELLKMAYNSPSADRPDWEVEKNNQRVWKTAVTAAVERVRQQWSNSDWVWHAQRVLAFAVGNLP